MTDFRLCLGSGMQYADKRAAELGCTLRVYVNHELRAVLVRRADEPMPLGCELVYTTDGPLPMLSEASRALLGKGE